MLAGFLGKRRKAGEVPFRYPERTMYRSTISIVEQSIYFLCNLSALYRSS